MSRRKQFLFVILALCGFFGCHHNRPQMTAVALSAWNRDEPEGIPFYLPKPLMIVAKNFHYVEEAKVGLTDTVPIPQGFDDQGKYADANARMAFNAEATTFPDFPSQSAATNSGTALKSGQHVYTEDGRADHSHQCPVGRPGA